MIGSAVWRFTRTTKYGIVCGCVFGLVPCMVGARLVAQQPQHQAVAAHVPENTSVDELLSRRITLHLKDVSLVRAIDSVSRTAKVFIQYQVPMLSAYSAPVTLDVTNTSLGVVLDQVLNGTALHVIPEGRDGLTIVALADGVTDSIPNVGTISGRVIDSATGRELPGVTIKVAGTKIVTTTRDSGQFVLHNVPVGTQTLTARVFGARPRERTVDVTKGQTIVVRLSLASVSTVLSGVVTTATGTQRKIEVGNDITVLNADSIMRVAPIANVTQMLATRVPGLIVQTISGIPGAPSRLRLRGASSVTTSDDPIVIVDGIRINAEQSGYTNNGGALVSGGGSRIQSDPNGSMQSTYAGPSALDQIDPNSIEKIEVLKGPSATATYGSDAANGVIVITTKKGRAGPTQWSSTLGLGRTTLPGVWPSFYHAFFKPFAGGDTYEGCRLVRCPGISAPLGDPLVAVIPYQALNDPRVSPLGTGSSRDASLTVRGGNDAVTYAVTGTGTTNTGYLHLPSFVAAAFQSTHGGLPAPRWMIDPTTYVTYGGTSNVTAQLGRQGATFSLMNSVSESAQQQSSQQNAIGSLEFQYVDHALLTQPWSANALADQLFPHYATRVQFHTTTFNNAVSLAQWSPWTWFPSVTATAGVSLMMTDNNSLTPRNYDRSSVEDTLGQYSVSRGTIETRTLQIGTALFPRSLVSAAVGVNVNSSTNVSYAAFTTGLPIGVTMPTSLPSTNVAPTQSDIETATYGWYLAPTFNLNSRFFVNPGFRFDGGTASGNRSQLNLFPKLDVSYVAVSRETAAPLGLTMLRPRIAFGIAGVQPEPGRQLRLFQNNEILPVVAGGSATPIGIATLTNLGNTQLQPERSQELEWGVDADLGPNQRVSVQLTGYSQIRYDAIMSLNVAPSLSLPQVGSSFGNPSGYDANVGTIRKRGDEASISAQIFDARSIGWSVNALISSERSIVTHLNNNLPSIVTGSGSSGIGGYQNEIVPGYPLNGIWTRRIESYADVNGDGFIENDEVRLGDSLVYFGVPQPKYETTVSTDVSLFNGRLKVSTSLDYQNGMTQVLSVSQASALGINDPNLTLAQQAAFAAIGTGNLEKNSAAGLLQTVSTLRWNTLSVSYMMPPAVLHLFHVPMLSLMLQGSNLGLHSNYRGKDPNVNAFSTGNLTADTGQLPQPRLLQLRVSINN